MVSFTAWECSQVPAAVEERGDGSEYGGEGTARHRDHRHPAHRGVASRDEEEVAGAPMIVADKPVAPASETGLAGAVGLA